jgi:hypothetical protein
MDHTARGGGMDTIRCRLDRRACPLLLSTPPG